jgi:uncharacterized protein (TIGR03382 family)
MFVFQLLSMAAIGLSAGSGQALECELQEVVDATPIANAGDGVVRLLYVNRCPGGCTVSSGQDDAVANTSTLVEGAAITLAEFPHGDAAWADMMTCLENMFGPYNINVTDVDPGDQPHFETMVAGSNSDLNRPGSAGVAPSACMGVSGAISYAFAYEIAGDGQSLCEVVAHEAGHTFGLEHAYLCEDPMTYLEGCGPKTFQDANAQCGTGAPEACNCGSTQNSHQHLLSVFGPGGQPAAIEVEILSVSEDPAASNGNGILEPGEQVSFELQLFNTGNQVATGASLEIDGKGIGDADEGLPTVPAGFTVAHQVSAPIQDSACGRETTIDVIAALGGKSSSASTTILPGVERSERPERFTDEAGWTTVLGEASQADWAFGVPQETIFAGRTLQPQQGAGGVGDAAWFTGLSGDWDESALAGRTALTSPTLDASDWHAISAVRLNLWYMAYARPNGGLEPSPDAHLIVELSGDDGETWFEAARITSDPLRWEELEVPVAAGFEPTATTRVRLVAVNDSSVDERLVEIGVDSIVLVGGQLTCTPTADSEGGGCSTSGSGSSALFPILLGLLAVFRRRRR